MGFTVAQRKKFFELVKKYETASRYNEEAKDLSKRIQAMSKDPMGLNELAQLITEDLEDEMKAYDIRPLFFGQVKPRELNETVEYKRKGKFRAYQITHGGYVPKSRIFQDVMTVEPTIFAVRPACDLLQLETGKISSVQELRDGARDALLTEYNRYTYATLETAIPDGGANVFTSAGGEVTKAALDDAIAYVSKWGPVSVIGTHTSLAPILDFSGYSDATLAQIERTGNLGVYRGAQLVKLEEFIDADDNPVIQEDKIFIVSQKAGHIDDFGELRNREIIDGEHDEYSVKIQTMWGLTVLHAEKMAKINITA
ncbi:HK97-fold major capsid protein [Priestia megaterium]|uniref:HK97-fold major capsid protein n=1 Tax=Priestia megaterium TaxID=1404 RepID=UPI00211C2A85|nr:HK97-fold major capsid protein [Priestia megaterium]